MAARFVDKREIKSVTDLTEIEAEQLRVAGIAYDGQELSAAERLSTEEPDQEGSFAGFCDLWRVVDGDEHLYDVWMYMVDSGSIFRAGSTEEIGGIIQCGLESDDPDIETQIGPAMVDAGLLPQSDSEYDRFARILRRQREAN